MKQFQLDLRTEADTQRLGRALADSLPAGATVGLTGTLGAGKTRLVQAVAKASGIASKLVVSPTFTLCNEYPGVPGINHWDLYRVVDEDDLLELGIEEYFASDSVTFVEWADRFPDSLPPDRLDIQLNVTGQSSRAVIVTARGPSAEEALAQLQRRWGAGTRSCE